jgi:hypothetical protein
LRGGRLRALWIILLEKRIGFRLVQERKQAFGNDRTRRAARTCILEECHGVERLLGGAEAQDVRLAVVDDGEMVFGFWLQRADREVVVARREGDQKICVRLFLNCNGPRVESRNCRGKEDSRVA